jgi:hypothetical protein
MGLAQMSCAFRVVVPRWDGKYGVAVCTSPKHRSTEDDHGFRDGAVNPPM